MLLVRGCSECTWWELRTGPCQEMTLSHKEIISEILRKSTQYSLEGLMLKLKLQCFGPPEAKSGLIGKDPEAGKD